MSAAEEIVYEDVPEMLPAVREDAPSPTLFGTTDPQAFIEAATATAKPLAEVVRKQKLTTTISGREHVRVEGWTLLGSMLGVFPVCVWTRKLENGWEARVEARTRQGEVVGAAEAECLRSESTWKSRDDYALRSMAQTRATSKALRQPLGFVMQLAGFDATPAEEMPHDGSHNGGDGQAADPHGLADSRADAVQPGQVIVPFGKHKGSQVKDVPRSYWDWWLAQDGNKNQEVLAAVELHLGLTAAPAGETVDPDIPF